MATFSDTTTRRIQLGALALLLTEVLLCALQVGGLSPQSVGLAVFWPLAWLGLGGLLGFLFGIPKVLQQEATDPTPGASRYVLGVNTNLEQISDWLTKLLIGVGLVELSRLPTAIATVALEMTGNTPGLTKSLAEAIIVLFSVEGFIGGYLCTRLYLPRELRRADQATYDEETREALAQAPVPVPEERPEVSEAQQKAAELVTERPLRDVRGQDVPLWARAQAIRNNPGEAITAFRSAIELDPKNPKLRVELTRLLNLTGNPKEAWSQVQEARALLKPPGSVRLAESVYEWLTYLPLWEGAEGIVKTIQYVDEFRERYPGVTVPGSILVNLTAAHGQQARALLEKGVPREAPEFREARAKALKALNETLTTGGSRWAPRLRQLLDPRAPGKAPDDNDLEVFESDNEFRVALGLAPVQQAA